MKVEDKILSYLNVNGPSLTIRIAKNIGEENIIASAFLSELASRKKIKISHLKIGTSPLYYLPGQEKDLVNFSSEVNPKDREVLEKLQNTKLLRESELELLEKVGLRSLKDFAIPLHVQFAGKKELFWKWYLLPVEEANNLISIILSDSGGDEQPIENKKIIEEKSVGNQSREVEQPLETKIEANEVVTKEDENRSITNIVDTYPPNTSDGKPSIETLAYPPNTTEKSEEESSQVYPVDTSDKDIEVESEVVNNETGTDNYQEVNKSVEETPEVIKKKEIIKKEPEVETEIKNESKSEKGNKKESKQKKLNDDVEEEKKSFVEKIKEKFTSKKTKKVNDEFLPVITDYLKTLDIEVESKNIIRKNREIDFIVNVPSVVGRMRYFCKAKNKQKCDEKDISTAYMEAQMKKIPLLFLYPNNINKKAEKLLKSEVFDNLIAKKIEFDE